MNKFFNMVLLPLHAMVWFINSSIAVILWCVKVYLYFIVLGTLACLLAAILGSI